MPGQQQQRPAWVPQNLTAIATYKQQMNELKGKGPDVAGYLLQWLQQIGAEVADAYATFQRDPTQKKHAFHEFINIIVDYNGGERSHRPVLLHDAFVALFYHYTHKHASTAAQHSSLFVASYNASREMGQQLLRAEEEGCGRELALHLLEENQKKHLMGHRAVAVPQQFRLLYRTQQKKEAVAMAGEAFATSVSPDLSPATSKEASSSQQTHMPKKMHTAGNPQAAPASAWVQNHGPAAATAPGGLAGIAPGMQVATWFPQVLQQVQALLDSMHPSQEYTDLQQLVTHLERHRQLVNGSLYNLINAYLQQGHAMQQDG